MWRCGWGYRFQPRLSSSATSATAHSITATNSNATATASLVNGQSIALVGGANSNNANTLDGINFANVTPVTNNTFNGLAFGTGYNNLITSANFSVTAAGAVTAASFAGNGASLTNLSGGNLTAGSVSNADLANSSLTVTAGNGLTGGGSVALGSSTSLAVAYGSAANTAVQGNVQVTCPSGSGNLSGGGTVITLGTGGTCGAISISNSPTFTGLVTSVGLTAGSGLIQGTGGLTITGNSTLTGTLGSLTGLTSSGTVTFSGLSSAGIVTNTSGGQLGTVATLPVANGGTNIPSYTIGDILYASGATTLSELA